MLRIRLARHGKKNDPAYRIVVINSQERRQGKSIDELGYWHPREDVIQIDKDKYKSWVEKGAQPSERVIKLTNK